jgi:hypothetical protein
MTDVPTPPPAEEPARDSTYEPPEAEDLSPDMGVEASTGVYGGLA